MKNKIQNRSLTRNAVLNGMKQVCSILFPFISFVYCSRVLGSEGIGIYSFGQSIVAYFLLVAALGIPNYAIREGARVRDNRKKLTQFINQVFSINCIMTVISYVLLFVSLFCINELKAYRIVILIQSIQIILTTLGTDWINSIFEDYTYLAIVYVFMQIISIVSLILFVKDSSDIYVYTVITMLSNAGGNIFNWFYLRKKYNIRTTFTFKIYWNEHIKAIVILFFNSVAVSIYMNSDITMLGFFTNDKTVGIYTVSSKIYSMVKTLINAVIMVTIPRFSYYIANNKQEEYRKLLIKIFNTLFLIIYPCLIGMFVEAKNILLLVAGDEYLSGQMVVKILSFTLIFAVYACFFSYSILIPNRLEKRFLQATIAAAVINISLNFIFIPLWSLNGAAVTTLIAEFIVCLITAYFSYKKFQIMYITKEMFSVLVGGIGIALTCYIIDSIINNCLLALLIDIIMSVLIYIFLLLLLKNKIMMELIKKLEMK